MVLRTDLVRRLTARAEGAGDSGESDVSLAERPEGRLRRESMQRLQFGLGGIAMMFLIVGLANVIDNRADMADAATVPEAVPAAQPSSSPMEDDPLVSAGVVPDLPAEPSPTQPATVQPPLPGPGGDAAP